MSHTLPLSLPRPAGARRLVGALLAVTALLTACDNPACIFGGNCSDDDGSSGAAPNPASAPSNHAWILAGAPRVTGFFPSGNSISTDTPIAVVFSESLSIGSIQGAFTLTLPSAGGPSFPIPTAAPTLVGDGRVLIVAPLTALTESTTYSLTFADTAVVTDLQGFALPIPVDRVIGTFTVAATNPGAPRVVTSFPPDGATNQGTTGEYIVVFDRKMNAGTFTFDSFAVEVNGATPVGNTLPQPVLLAGTGGIPAADTRVWRYRAEDSNNEAVPFATSASVELTLSPAGDQLAAAAVGGGVLAETVLDYTTAAFGAPTSAEITSLPDDAIGIDNLNGTTPLAVGLQLVNAQANDMLDMFLFGTSTEAEPRTISLGRSVRLGDVPSFDVLLQTVTLGEAQLDLASSASPVEAHFADGSIAVAFSLRRGGNPSPVRLLDVDQAEPGVQQAQLDVTRPTLTGFGSSGTNTTSLRSTSRDLVVVGRASERLNAAEVVAGAANNGALASIVASNSSGLFIAQAVPLGVVDPALLPVTFQLTLYDRAMNRSTSAYSASFTQLGALVDSTAVSAGSLQVEVFDARTLAVITGADVYVHEDLAGTLTALDDDTTPASGVVTLTAALGESVVTVDAAGYELFTYYGVPTNRISVALERSNVLPGTVQGAISTSSADLPQFDRYVADTRTFEADEPEITVQSCTFNPQTLTWQCGFGPRPLRLGLLGGVSFVAVDPPASAFTFNAQTFLRGYSLELPFASVNPGSLTSTVSFSVNQLLDDPDTAAEELSIEGPAALLDASAAAGIDLTQLDGDPRVAIQGRVPGLSGAVLAGFGVALDPQGSPASAWIVRSALPGVADPFDDDGAGTNDELGELVEDGTLEPELYLRCEVRDDLGARAGQRLRFAQTPPLPVAINLPSTPQVLAPTAGSTTAGSAYDIDFDDVIADGSGQSGLYRVTLVANNGRQWLLYRADQTGAAQGNVELPDLAALGGTPLADGTITCAVSAFAWASFSASPLALTDVEREHELSATCAPISFTQQ